MKNVLQRKDGTSIICTQLFQTASIRALNVKLVSMSFAITLITVGILIMVVTI